MRDPCPIWGLFNMYVEENIKILAKSEPLNIFTHSAGYTFPLTCKEHNHFESL
jgi:hypothetical protein